MAAVRHAVFAERATPLLADMEQVASATVDRKLPPNDLRRLLTAKAEASRLIPAFREALYPEDEPLG